MHEKMRRKLNKLWLKPEKAQRRLIGLLPMLAKVLKMPMNSSKR